jgi:hypothetical protein
MNLKTLSSTELLSRTKSLVSEERRISTDVLHHLREIERRRIFAEAGFSSLFAYCVSELKYSEGSAYRRISAMRLLKECPEIEESIRDGSLSPRGGAIQPTRLNWITSFHTRRAVSRSCEISGSDVVRTTSSMRSKSLAFQRWLDILLRSDLSTRLFQEVLCPTRARANHRRNPERGPRPNCLVNCSVFSYSPL